MSDASERPGCVTGGAVNSDFLGVGQARPNIFFIVRNNTDGVSVTSGSKVGESGVKRTTGAK